VAASHLPGKESRWLRRTAPLALAGCFACSLGGAAPAEGGTGPSGPDSGRAADAGGEDGLGRPSGGQPDGHAADAAATAIVEGGPGSTESGASGGDEAARVDAGASLPGSDAAAPAPADPAAALGHCAAPRGARWSDALAAYAKWKGDLVTADGADGFRRVRRPNSPGAIDTSNSEGTAYGMILAVAMDDQALFDDLWRYEQHFLDANGLMNWEIDPQGNGPTGEGTGAATDADEDMAYALLWADHRWGGAGRLPDSYGQKAPPQVIP